MKCVADTNVLAYFLLRTEPFFLDARSFWRRVDEVWAPDSWRTEFLNILWLAVRQGAIEAPGAEKRLLLAERLVTHTCSVLELRRAALRLAIRHAHPAYDTVFVALAVREKTPIATYDRKLLESFPDIARRPSEIVED